MRSIPPPLRFRRVFGDSSAYAALLDRNDSNHHDAVSILNQINIARFRLTTANTIIIEAHALILSTLGGEQARRFLRDVRSSNTAIVRVRAQDEERAQQVLFRYTDKAWSFTDAISFVLMERLNIYHAFTFDADFTQYGFTALRPDLQLP